MSSTLALRIPSMSEVHVRPFARCQLCPRTAKARFSVPGFDHVSAYSCLIHLYRVQVSVEHQFTIKPLIMNTEHAKYGFDSESGKKDE